MGGITGVLGIREMEQVEKVGHAWDLGVQAVFRFVFRHKSLLLQAKR